MSCSIRSAVLALLAACLVVVTPSPASAEGYVTVSPSAVDMGVVPAGEVRRVPVTVTAEATISIMTVVASRSVYYTGPFRIENNRCGGTMTAGQSCSFDVVVEAAARGTYSTDVFFNYNGPGRTYGHELRASATVAVPPSVPQAMSVEPASAAGEAAVSWSLPEDDGGAPLSGFRLERWVGDAWVTVSEPIVTAMRITDTGLGEGTLVEYRLAAVNAIGSSAWVYGSTTTWARPSAPTNVTVSRARRPTGQLVRWEPPADDGGTAVTRYEVLRKVRGRDETVVAVLGPEELKWFDASRLKGETSYAVRAANAVGVGILSSWAAVR